MNSKDYSQEVALITGASSGIGAAFASALAAQGCDLLLIARRSDRLAQLANELRQRYSVNVEFLQADLSVNEDLALVEKKILSTPNISFLVNNAGFGVFEIPGAINFEDEEKMVKVHILASIRLMNCAMIGMRDRKKGAIINVSSVASFFPVLGNSTYGISKAFLNSFSESLARVVRNNGIKVQALCPGFTYTEFHDRLNGFNRHKIPGFMWMSADEVVKCSLDNLGKNKVIVVPGRIYQIIALFAQSWFAGLAYKIYKRR